MGSDTGTEQEEGLEAGADPELLGELSYPAPGPIAPQNPDQARCRMVVAGSDHRGDASQRGGEFGPTLLELVRRVRCLIRRRAALRRACNLVSRGVPVEETLYGGRVAGAPRVAAACSSWAAVAAYTASASAALRPMQVMPSLPNSERQPSR